MKRILFLVIFCISSHLANSWGPTGHRVTGEIAEQYLTKKAKRKIDYILNKQSLAIASTWMDEVRSDSLYNHTHDWHWVTIPDGMTYAQTEKNPKGDIIVTLERIIAALKSKTLSPKEEAEHLKMLIHLVGDIHQPLHVGRGDDQGGNKTTVMWFRGDSNLHRVWDSDMIDGSQLSYTELAASLDKPSEELIHQWQQSSVIQWAEESMKYRKEVYSIENGRLGYGYSYKHFPSVRLRLLQAGIRLAGVLNEIYG